MTTLDKIDFEAIESYVDKLSNEELVEILYWEFHPCAYPKRTSWLDYGLMDHDHLVKYVLDHVNINENLIWLNTPRTHGFHSRLLS